MRVGNAQKIVQHRYVDGLEIRRGDPAIALDIPDMLAAIHLDQDFRNQALFWNKDIVERYDAAAWLQRPLCRGQQGRRYRIVNVMK